MYGFWLFIHLSGLCVWLGSLVAVGILLSAMKKQIHSADVGALVKKTVRTFNFLTHPSAFLVLISGVLMLLQMGIGSDKPFWMIYMERVGGMVILLFIIVISIMGRRLVKRISSGGVQSASSSISSYVTGLAVSSALVFSIIFVVSGKY
jgi:putative copper export protein